MGYLRTGAASKAQELIVKTGTLKDSNDDEFRLLHQMWLVLV